MKKYWVIPNSSFNFNRHLLYFGGNFPMYIEKAILPNRIFWHVDYNCFGHKFKILVNELRIWPML